MLRITVEHKYCGCTRVIEGETLIQAFKNSNTNMDVWIVIDIEKRDF